MVKRVHFIGICGTGMATLAILLRQRGFNVGGSDQHVYPPMSDLLERHGISLQSGYQEDHISPDLDLVVIGNAVSRGNPEVEAVLDRKLRYASLPEVVRNELLWGARTAVVSGTHGKTTAAFMLAWMLRGAGGDPSFLIGGMSRDFDTSGHLGSDDMFVIEGDEYDSAFFDKTAKFLKYLPEVVIVNNLEFDHADIYRGLDELRLAFRRLVRTIPRSGRLLVNADDVETRALADEALCPVETFGFADTADWRAQDLVETIDGTAFEVSGPDGTAAMTMPLIGRFNVRNAVGAIAAASALGAPPVRTAPALAVFTGVKRRLETRGVVRGITVYDDFAHHPTAVRETLEALRARASGGRLWAIFEPRSATACRRVFQSDFARSLRIADEVVVAAVPRQEIPKADRLSETTLVEDLTAVGVSAQFLPTVDDIVSAVARRATPLDQIVVMSNGGFGGIHEKLLSSLERPV